MENQKYTVVIENEYTSRPKLIRNNHGRDDLVYIPTDRGIYEIAGEEHDPSDTNSDVWVKFDDSSEWVATFFTYTNIQSLTAKNQRTGECLTGKYFWASDMVLVDEVTRNRIEEVIDYLIKTGEFELIFSNISASRLDSSNAQ